VGTFSGRITASIFSCDKRQMFITIYHTVSKSRSSPTYDFHMDAMLLQAIYIVITMKQSHLFKV